MIKSQAIVDLWVSSGNLLDNVDAQNLLENATKVNLMMGRLSELCKAHHNMSVIEVIPEYTRQGWIIE